MNDDWGKFWLAIAIMALAGAIAANLAFGSPIQIGALAQWASAFATLAAVWVALQNTQRTIVSGERSAERARIKKEEVFTTTVIALSDQVKQSLEGAARCYGNADLDKKSARELVSVFGLGALVERIDRVPIYEAHDPELIHFVSAMRLVAHNAQILIESCINGEGELPIDFRSEMKLLETNRTILCESMPELFWSVTSYDENGSLK